MKQRLTIHLFTFLLLLSAVSARAAAVTVTNTNDDLAGSLRQAIKDAKPNDVIVFDIPTSDPGYDTWTGVYTIDLTSAGLTIDKALTIYGVVNGVVSKIVVRRNAGNSFSIFSVTPGTFVIIDSITISNGSGTAGYGGGIYNEGILFLCNCTLSGNQAASGGGGLCNLGNAVVRDCTFTANEAPFGGGAILNAATLMLNESTLSGNDASNNSGAVYSLAGATTHVRNTIVAGNTGSVSNAPDVFGIFISDGYNFIGVGDGSTGFGNPGSHDQVGSVANPADPKLGPLGDHGGPTSTIGPLPGSLVIDQGKRETDADGVPVSNFDQRGFPRPVDQDHVVDVAEGDGSDIGAVELSEFQTGPDYNVTTSDDHDDAACGPEDCTLREALSAANANADANTISFAPDIGDTITNTLTPTGFVITQPVTINGPGARLLTISGGDANRCLQVIGGTVVINGLTFAHGSSGSTPGGAIQNTNAAVLTLNDCTFSQNNNVVTYGGAVAQLGAGVLNVNRCTFADNNGGIGGGLGNFEGTVVVTNSTFTRNSAQNGGAIASTQLGFVLARFDLRSSTVVGNEATTLFADGGGVRQSGGTVTVTNSIIAANTSEGTAPDVSGAFVSQGSNLIGHATGSTGFDVAAGDQVGVDPNVGTFGNHGGLTDTVPLLAGSLAINEANATTAPERDQRNYVRPDAPDVGAFEFGGTIPVTLANISTRLSVGTGDNVLIGGFIVTGTEAKKVLIRAIGPSLPLAGFLANPTLELYDSGGLIISNDNWKTTQQDEIEATKLQPPNDLESAILATLPANAAYTAILRGVNSSTGIGLVEVYDLDRTVDSKLANISTRGLVQTGDNVIIGGLIVLGADPQEVVIRAIGPSLPLAGKLGNPILELHDGNGAMLASNDNWRSDQEAEIFASNLAPSNDLESAIVATLAPAAYTAIVRGVADTTGIALVEAYALTP